MNSVIKILREQNHYTQTKLAEDLEISRQALIKYENMELESPVSVVRSLSNIFGVSYDCIIDNYLPLELDDADKERLSVIEHSFVNLPLPALLMLTYFSLKRTEAWRRE